MSLDWPDDRTFKLIGLYEQQPCLYDYTSPEYHNRVLKVKAWQQLAEECGVSRMQFCIRNLSPIV